MKKKISVQGGFDSIIEKFCLPWKQQSSYNDGNKQIVKSPGVINNNGDIFVLIQFNDIDKLVVWYCCSWNREQDKNSNSARYREQDKNSNSARYREQV